MEERLENDRQYLSVEEAARLLHVAPSTVRRWIRKGTLKALTKRVTYLLLSDVESMMNLKKQPRKGSPQAVLKAMRRCPAKKKDVEELMRLIEEGRLPVDWQLSLRGELTG